MLDRGGVVGGTSARAEIQAAESFQVPNLLQRAAGSLASTSPRPTDERNVSFLQTFGFPRSAIVIPHVIQRRQESRLASVQALRPGMLVIGIDAGAAIVAHAGSFEVIGHSKVLVPNGKQSDAGLDALLPGDRFDVVRRTPLEGKGRGHARPETRRQLAAWLMGLRMRLRAEQGKVHSTEPASRRSRPSTTMPSLVADALKAHQVRQPEERPRAGRCWHQTGPAFTTTIGTLMGARKLTDTLHATVSRAGPPSVRVRNPRNTAPTLLPAQGVEIRTIMEVQVTPRSTSPGTATSASCRLCRPTLQGRWMLPWPSEMGGF